MDQTRTPIRIYVYGATEEQEALARRIAGSAGLEVEQVWDTKFIDPPITGYHPAIGFDNIERRIPEDIIDLRFPSIASLEDTQDNWGARNAVWEMIKQFAAKLSVPEPKQSPEPINSVDGETASGTKVRILLSRDEKPERLLDSTILGREEAELLVQITKLLDLRTLTVVPSKKEQS